MDFDVKANTVWWSYPPCSQCWIKGVPAYLHLIGVGKFFPSCLVTHTACSPLLWAPRVAWALRSHGLSCKGTLFLASASFCAQPVQVGQGGSAFAPQLSHPLPMCTLPIFLIRSGKVCQMKSYFSGLTKDKLSFLPLAMTVVGLRP